MSFSDISYMKRALALAEQAQWNCPPNPAVGCVIVKDRQIIGEGFTQKTGQAHAEVMALRDAQAKGHDVSGATVYVTLEPCAHYGRTPPCALALVNAKVARVVAALKDPNPQVAGKGLGILSNAGIEVECGVCEKEATEINIGFLQRMRCGKPFVRTKIAASVDGNIALQNGQSKWITAAAAREDGQRWRARAGAVLTGCGTVQADNPQLNVRLEGANRQPLKVIVDSHMSLTADFQIFHSGETLLVCSELDQAKALAFKDLPVEILALPGTDGRVDLNALIQELGRREINEVHVEAGPTLNASLMSAGLIDECLLYIAPKFLGAGKRLIDLPALQSLETVPQYRFETVEKIGEDLRLQIRPTRS